MHIRELQQQAEELGITYRVGMTKAYLSSAIEAVKAGQEIPEFVPKTRKGIGNKPNKVNKFAIMRAERAKLVEGLNQDNELRESLKDMTKAQKIRAMLSLGHNRTVISEYLGCMYQEVYNHEKYEKDKLKKHA